MTETFDFELFDFSLKTFKTREGFAIYGDIPERQAEVAARLFIASQLRGAKLRIHAELVESEPGDLAEYQLTRDMR